MNEKDKIVYQRLIYYNDEEHLAKRIIELQHCCGNLQSKIDKAIEYIEEHTDKLGKIKIPKIDFNYNELSDILKEAENVKNN